MKRLRVNENQRVVLLDNQKIDALLKEGAYWIFRRKDFISYFCDSIYSAPHQLDYFLKNSDFEKAVTVYQVNPDQILIKRINNVISQVLGEGSYIEFKDIQSSTVEIVDISNVDSIKNFSLSELNSKAMSQYIKDFNIEMGHVGLLMVNEVLRETLSTGKYYFWKNQRQIELITVDKRLQSMDITGQEILTLDKVNVRSNISFSFQIEDEVKAVLKIKEVRQQLYVMVQNEVRYVLSSLSLDQILAQKEQLGEMLLERTKKEAKYLGIEIRSMGIKDVILPGEVKTIMNKVIMAEKEALANTISRREETAATRSLLNTAKLMENNPMLFKLKEMEYVEKIAEKVGEISISGNGKMINELRTIFTR